MYIAGITEKRMNNKHFVEWKKKTKQKIYLKFNRFYTQTEVYNMNWCQWGVFFIHFYAYRKK